MIEFPEYVEMVKKHPSILNFLNLNFSFLNRPFKKIEYKFKRKKSIMSPSLKKLSPKFTKSFNLTSLISETNKGSETGTSPPSESPPKNNFHKSFSNLILENEEKPVLQKSQTFKNIDVDFEKK